MFVVRKMKSEFDYVMSQSEKLESGKWIAVVGNDIVAQGDDAKEVFDKAKDKHPEREPFIMKVPSDSIMLL
jgi:hypothetical protein